jgi:SAM-dependent methyltransferase
MSTASELAQAHWNRTPLFFSEEERYRIYPWLYEAAEFRYHGGHKVLEIGCGTGCDLLQFAKHGAEAYGIDITEEHLRLAKERVGDKADVRFGDARALPFPDATFDYVYSHGVLMHSSEPEKIATEIFRVLKPGGRFMIHVYSRWSYITLRLLTLHGRQWRRGTEGPELSSVHVDLYTARRLRKLFSSFFVVCSKEELVIAGHRIPAWTCLPNLLGWFLVAEGWKPAVAGSSGQG